MKPETTWKGVSIAIVVVFSLSYLLSLSYNNWHQSPVPMKGESKEKYLERVDSCLRPYVDSAQPDTLKWKLEPINEIEKP